MAWVSSNSLRSPPLGCASRQHTLTARISQQSYEQNAEKMFSLLLGLTGAPRRPCRGSLGPSAKDRNSIDRRKKPQHQAEFSSSREMEGGRMITPEPEKGAG
jgi:hypothetical protein